MPFTRVRLGRRRTHSLRLQSGHQFWTIYIPDVAEPLVVEGFGDAAQLATELVDMGAAHEVVVLLDERRVVAAMLIDPPAEVGLLVGVTALPGVDTPFCQTLCIVIEPEVATGPASVEDRTGYQALRRAHMAQGLLLLDVVLTDGNTVRSLAIGCDPDPVWFDEFDPLPDPDEPE